jgi:hypothetical protein
MQSIVAKQSQILNSPTVSAISYFQLCNTNKDKKLSKAEKKACITKCDTNKNGKVSQQEKRVCRGVKSRTPKPTKSTTPVVHIETNPTPKPTISPVVINQKPITLLLKPDTRTPAVSSDGTKQFNPKTGIFEKIVGEKVTSLLPQDLENCLKITEFQYQFNTPEVFLLNTSTYVIYDEFNPQERIAKPNTFSLEELNKYLAKPTETRKYFGNIVNRPTERTTTLPESRYSGRLDGSAATLLDETNVARHSTQNRINAAALDLEDERIELTRLLGELKQAVCNNWYQKESWEALSDKYALKLIDFARLVDKTFISVQEAKDIQTTQKAADTKIVNLILSNDQNSGNFIKSVSAEIEKCKQVGPCSEVYLWEKYALIDIVFKCKKDVNDKRISSFTTDYSLLNSVARSRVGSTCY